MDHFIFISQEKAYVNNSFDTVYHMTIGINRESAIKDVHVTDIYTYVSMSSTYHICMKILNHLQSDTFFTVGKIIKNNPLTIEYKVRFERDAKERCCNIMSKINTLLNYEISNFPWMKKGISLYDFYTKIIGAKMTQDAVDHYLPCSIHYTSDQLYFRNSYGYLLGIKTKEIDYNPFDMEGIEKLPIHIKHNDKAYYDWLFTQLSRFSFQGYKLYL